MFVAVHVSYSYKGDYYCPKVELDSIMHDKLIDAPTGIHTGFFSKGGCGY